MSSRAEGTPIRSNRRSYIDWARGLAVLIMIEAHVLDSWTLRSERATAAFGYLNILGGFAAPLFLWLAGVSVVLAAEQGRLRLGDRKQAGSAVMRRGLEIFGLAFLFRLQAFILSPGNPPVSLLRVDILNIMGPSMVAAAFLWRSARDARSAAIATGAVAAALALATPLVRAAGLGALPAPLQWYVSPAGNHSTFTLFPWAGFVFAGAAFGALLSMADRQREGRTLWRLALAGGLIAMVSYYASTRPSIYAASSFWTTSPTYFGLRVGALMVGMATLFALTPVSMASPRPFTILGRLGRHSLFVYWIHVELVYGYATMVIHHQLPLWANAFAYAAFSALMYLAIGLRDRVVDWWRARPSHPMTPETIGA